MTVDNPDQANVNPPEAGESLRKTREQAGAYLEARYGKDVWFRAPETFGPFEQWIWAVAGGRDDFAEEVMTKITDHFRQQGG